MKLTPKMPILKSNKSSLSSMKAKRSFNSWNANRNQNQALQRVPEARINILDQIIQAVPYRVESNLSNNVTASKDFISGFADDVLTNDVLRNLLPSSTWKTLQQSINDPNHHLDAHTADQVANAMKDWALSKGATHFTHWFHPLSGVTSEKHDSFLTYSRKDDKFIVDFSGKELMKGEPDASSFPSGGVRVTSQARGYTIWDMTSPPFIKKGANGSSLYIPTVFCSWTGEALDYKTPLLRSEEAISREVSRLLNFSGNVNIKSIKSLMGTEQEFFLIDRGYYLNRPDLVNVGRTIIGAAPSKSQESEYHYFGAIDQRVLACLQDLEKELWKLGIPVKSRHNEVAPSQFEFAPIFEASSIAADHNLLAMEILKETATRHGLTALLHEKPFNYVNGSGKHLNWSLETNESENLLDPTNNPHDNTQFLIVLGTILHALRHHGDLLRACIAVPGNTYRLGANEAPPVIISAYLGSELEDVCKTIISENLSSSSQKQQREILKLGINNIPPVLRDSSDRNRTSPFAFTGNRFEFRAVGSSQNISFPIAVLNSIVADSARIIADELEKRTMNVKSKEERELVVRRLAAELLKENFHVVFGGNGYSEEWILEAQRRGLPLLKTAPEALSVFDKQENIELFDRLNVLSPTELASRAAVLNEAFLENLVTEARILIDLMTTRVLPSSVSYQDKLSVAYANTLSILKDDSLLVNQKRTISDINSSIEELTSLTSQLKSMLHSIEHALKVDDHRVVFKTYYNPLMDLMPKIRAISDYLESSLDSSMWPLPKYDEIFLTSK